MMSAIGAAVIAIIAAALWRFAHSAVRDRFTMILAILVALSGMLAVALRGVSAGADRAGGQRDSRARCGTGGRDA
jgi:hypothetical protein